MYQLEEGEESWRLAVEADTRRTWVLPEAVGSRPAYTGWQAARTGSGSQLVRLWCQQERTEKVHCELGSRGVLQAGKAPVPAGPSRVVFDLQLSQVVFELRQAQQTSWSLG